MFLILLFSAAFIISLLTTHRTRAWALRANLVDVPDGDRRCHEHPVPRIGGIAIFVSVMAVLLVAYAMKAWQPASIENNGAKVLAIVFGGCAMFALGLIDDLRNLRPTTKLGVQTLIAVVVFAAGLKIDQFSLLAGGAIELPTVVSLLLTVLWLVGLANAFNLIDGSDGVAAGGALFAALTLAIVSLLSGNMLGAAVSLAIAGATLGFLFFNFPPATIFLGDGGSLFLGFTIGAVGLMSTGKAPTVLAVAIPVVSCGLPILDTTLTLIRRFLRNDPIFVGDRGHIHHRLRELGHSPREVALLLYAGFAAFALLSLLLVKGSGLAVASVFIIAGGVLLVAVQRLNIPELLEVQRVFGRGLQQRSVIAHNVRIRRAANDLRHTNSLSEILTAFGRAFGSGEFEKVELSLYGGTIRIVEPESVDELSDQQTIVITDLNSGRAQWELRIPLRTEQGAEFGHLSFWQARDSEFLLTDIRLVALHLQPELIAAIQRIHTPPRARPDKVHSAAMPAARKSLLRHFADKVAPLQGDDIPA